MGVEDAYYKNNMTIYNTKWHRWFAWKPVTIGEERYWLKFVYRRKMVTTYTSPQDFAGSMRFDWQYGTLFDVIRTA